MNENTELVVLFITTASTEEAQRMAEVLLKQRKAASVNILPKVNSLFWWHGKINSAEENLLIVKTKALQLNEVIRLVKENHSYEIPAIIALPIVDGSKDYLKWLSEEVK